MLLSLHWGFRPRRSRNRGTQSINLAPNVGVDLSGGKETWESKALLQA